MRAQSGEEREISKGESENKGGRGGVLRDVLKCARGIPRSYSNLSAQTCLRARAPPSAKCEILPTE